MAELCFSEAEREAIRAGGVDLAFRVWTAERLSANSQVRSPGVGQLRIESVEWVSPEEIDSEQARRAGYANRDALFGQLALDGYLFTRSTFGVSLPEMRQSLPGSVGEAARIARVRFSIVAASETGETPVATVNELAVFVMGIDDRVATPWAMRAAAVLTRDGALDAREFAAELGVRDAAVKSRLYHLVERKLLARENEVYRLTELGAKVFAMVMNPPSHLAKTVHDGVAPARRAVEESTPVARPVAPGVRLPTKKK